MSGRSGGTPRGKVTLPETIAGYPEFSPQEIKKEPNPFTDPDWRMLSYAWSGFALRILLVLGGLFSVYQYMQAREERRVERTLQLVEVWERPDYQNAQRALRRRLEALDAVHAASLGSSPSRAATEIYDVQLGLKALSEDVGGMTATEFREHFERLVYFLNRVAFCVEERLCSRTVADAYFLDYSRSFWRYFSEYVVQRREDGAAGYARPVESYLAITRPEPAK